MKTKISQMTNRRGTLIYIAGATGVGKTGLSIELSQRFNAPILSCDSRQVFREMSIGTAVPTPKELTAAPHYFIHTKSIHDRFSAGDFETEALELLAELFEVHPVVLMVGGSGLYANALLYGFDDLPMNQEVREQLNSLTIEELLAELKLADPQYYAEVDRANLARVRRAVEVCRISGMPYSSQRTRERRIRAFDTITIAIDRPRDELYARINERVDQMIREGLVAEAHELQAYRTLAPLQTVGYRELFDHFDGTTETIEQAVELIKRNTRRYAKRQLTWLRGQEGVRWFDATDNTAIIEYINGYI